MSGATGLDKMARLPIVKTAVIGASGFIGRYFWKAYRRKFPDCIGTSFSNSGEGLTMFDLRQPVLSALRLKETGHDAILISSAKANVAYCEQNKKSAYEVNVLGTLELVRQAACEGIKVIFLSTDYVFDGRVGSYDDDSQPNPATEYGRQKAVVEAELPSLTDDYLILRLSKIFGMAKGDGTLLDNIAADLSQGRAIKAARDQIFCPTFVNDFVEATLSAQERGLRGVMNVCNPQPWSRWEVAYALAQSMGKPAKSLVHQIMLYDIPQMAGRPLDTSMRCSRFQNEIGMIFTPLKLCIEDTAKQWMPQVHLVDLF